MQNLKLINYIATHPQYTNIVIKDEEDKTPMQAIELLSSFPFDNDWKIKEGITLLLIY